MDERASGAARRRLAFCCLVSVLLVSCSREPTSFSRGDRIPLGPFSLTVSHAQVSDADAESRRIAVQYRCEGIDSEEMRKQFRRMFIGRISIVDQDGNKYPTLPPMKPGDYGRALRIGSEPAAGSESLSDWVAAAKVPKDSQGLALVIENPEHRDGQPWLAVVALGR